MEYNFTAWVAELEYAADSKSAGRKALRVRVSPQAHKKIRRFTLRIFNLYIFILSPYPPQKSL